MQNNLNDGLTSTTILYQEPTFPYYKPKKFLIIGVKNIEVWITLINKCILKLSIFVNIIRTEFR